MPELKWSSQQISRRLELDYPYDGSMRVSHETIYLSIFQPVRKALRPRRTASCAPVDGCGVRWSPGNPQVGDGSGTRCRSSKPPHVDDHVLGGHWAICSSAGARRRSRLLSWAGTHRPKRWPRSPGATAETSCREPRTVPGGSEVVLTTGHAGVN